MKFLLSTLAYALCASAIAQTPTPSPTATPVAVSKAVVAWNASPDPNVVAYNVYASKTAGLDPATGKFASPIGFKVQGIDTTTFTFTNLTDGTYYIAVTAANGAGVESIYSNVITISIQSTPPPPVTGLRIVSQAATPMAKRTARIDWETSEPTTGKILYWASPDKTQVARDAKLAIAHKLRLTGLKKGTGYRYQIFATAKSGSHIVSPAAEFQIE